MRKLYGFFNKTFSLLITTCSDNAWHVYILMPPPPPPQSNLGGDYFVYFWGGGLCAIFPSPTGIKFAVTGRFNTSRLDTSLFSRGVKSFTYLA